MFPSWLSPISLYGDFLHHRLSAVDLSPQTLNIDEQTTMHFWGPSPNPNPPTKPSLVLIHGFGPDGVWQWLPQILFFAAHYRVYVPSLLFFGGSTTKSPDRSPVFQAKCVSALLERLGVREFSVAGTGYGGFVAYEVGRMWGDGRVRKVVIASCDVNMKRKDEEELVKRAKVEKIEDLVLPVTAGQLRRLLSFSTFRRLPYLPDFVFNHLLQKLYVENREEKLKLLEGLSHGRDETVDKSPLQQVQEVLILWGEHDQIFLLEKALELKELLGKKVRLEVIRSASHLPQLEHGTRFNNIVNHFLHCSE
nr:monoacylglycerol lipase ABHD6-like [Ipomoea batatas]